MNWDDLRFVLAAHRARTLVGAGEALSVTHTTVGRRLRAAEQAWGVRLFDRTPEGLAATAAGEELVALAERMEEELLATEARVRGRDVALRGSLRVSTLDFVHGLFQPAFAAFLARYPEVELTVTTPMQSVSLTRREADVALRLTNAPDPGLVGRRLGALTFAPFASPALMERHGAKASLRELPWIGYDRRLDMGWMEAWLHRHAPGARVVVRVDESPLLIRQLLLAGQGVGFLPIPEGEALGLRRLEPALREFSMSVWLLTLRDLRQNSRVRAFLDHMGELLPPLLEAAERA
ncbi:MAG: LysR family transcriptional regulator [Alphaproteobacteria bacterium]|nr:LysR family transcriptional regulator [Alphaproteobacteria bacterium]